MLRPNLTRAMQVLVRDVLMLRRLQQIARHVVRAVAVEMADDKILKESAAEDAVHEPMDEPLPAADAYTPVSIAINFARDVGHLSALRMMLIDQPAHSPILRHLVSWRPRDRVPFDTDDHFRRATWRPLLP